MGSSFSLKNISKYRPHMFAIAMILIVFHHFSFKYDSGIIGSAYMFLRVTGAVGVDIFLFLSGLGCYYSFSKDENTMEFYKRRLKRLLPAYLVVAIIAYFITDIIISGNGILTYLSNVSLIAFWINGGSDWYIAASLFLYLFFPLMYFCTRKCKIGYVIIIGAWAIICIVLYLISNEYFDVTSRLWARVPVFILGMMIAPKIKEGLVVKNGKLLFVVSIIVNLISLVAEAFLAIKGSEYAYSFEARLIYCPLAISTVFILSYIFSKVDLLVIKKCLTFIGGITLEIYMLNQRIIDLCTFIGSKYINNELFYILLWNCIGVVLTVILSWGLHLFIDKVMQKKLRE